jgi:hypothetical protein
MARLEEEMINTQSLALALLLGQLLLERSHLSLGETGVGFV